MVTVGVDLGGSSVHTFVLGEGNDRLGASHMKTPPSGDRATVLDVVDAGVHAALGEAGVAMSDVSRVGIGTPGVVMDGTVGGASNVPGWQERFSLREGLSQKLGVAVRVVNDITAAAAGESEYGAAAGHEQVLVVFVGRGVGAGLIVHGQPHEGAFGGAGEFGHMVVGLGGAVCPCGRRGCVEAYAGRRAIELAAQRAVDAGQHTVLFDGGDAAHGTVTSAGVRAALDRGDELTADLLDAAVAALGAGIASAVNLLDVESVVLGGGLADAMGDSFRRRVEAAMLPHLFLSPPRVEVLAAVLGGDAAALGAAVLARD
jgi:glucokinase